MVAGELSLGKSVIIHCEFAVRLCSLFVGVNCCF